MKKFKQKDFMFYIIAQVIIIGILVVCTYGMVEGVKSYYYETMVNFEYVDEIFEIIFICFGIVLVISIMVNTFTYKDFKEFKEERKRLKEKRNRKRGETIEN